MGAFKKKFREIKKLPDWIFVLPALLLKVIFRLFYRFELVDPNGYSRTAEGCIGLAWHNRLLFFAAAFPEATRKRCMAVVSASRDGQYVADFIARFGIGALRGSSSRRGMSAQLAAVSAIREGKNVIFTPDGPRGPRYVIKAGPVHLAGLTGAKIIPISINAGRCWSCRSWDRFQIPKPFTRVQLVLGDAIAVPAGLDSAGLEEWRKKVENAMLEITVDPS